MEQIRLWEFSTDDGKYSSNVSDQEVILKDHPQWIKSRKEVIKNPNNITAWDELMKSTESLISVKPLTEDIKSIIRSIFDELLTRFPLFFGYWKKYVSIEYQLSGLDGSIEILSRSIESFPNSLDLWIDYISILITNKDLNDIENVKIIRNVLEKSIEKIGWQFLSHPLWDKYIHFETNLKHQNNFEKICLLLKIYLQIIEIPLHQYSRFFKDFNELKKNFTSEQLIELDPKLKSAINDSADKKSFVTKYYNDIFTNTAKNVNDRWKFESKFKPNYFNLVELKYETLKLFQEYLEYEELNGVKQQVITLYERILIPAACYEKFWLKYLNYLVKNNFESEKIQQVYSRAINIFLPLNKNQLRISYLYYLENLKNFEELNELYLLYLNNFQNNSELRNSIFIKYLNYLSRTNFKDYKKNILLILKNQFKQPEFLNVEKKYLKGSINKPFEELSNVIEKSDQLALILLNNFLNHIWIMDQTTSISIIHQYYKIFQTKLFVKLSNDNEFWINYFNFLKFTKDYSSLKKLIHIIRNTTSLSPKFIDDISLIYIDYFQSNIQSISQKLSISPNLIHIEIFNIKKDIQSSKLFQKSQKSRINNNEIDYDRQLWKSNGNIGVEINERPMVVNPLLIKNPLVEIPPSLPNYRNVEKASMAIKYPTIDEI